MRKSVAVCVETLDEFYQLLYIPLFILWVLSTLHFWGGENQVLLCFPARLHSISRSCFAETRIRL